MSSTTIKMIAVVSVLAAIVMVLLGFQFSRNFAEQAQKAQEQVSVQEAKQTLAVVALRPLAAYEPIPRDAIALVPVSIVPPANYGSIDDVVDKVPLVDIDAGAPVTQRYFREGNALVRVIPPGHQAVSVEVNDVVAVGGFVRPGDIVDVLLFLRSGAGMSDPQSRVLLEGTRVLAYEERIIDRPEGIKSEDKQRARVRTAVLAVPEKDTTKLMLGASIGELRLALRGQAPVTDVAAADAAAPAAPATPDPAAAPGASAKAAGTPDKAISLAELSRLQQKSAGQAAPRPKVEILRGSALETVTTQ
ncbi:MAG TPA: Flp pilus assembly protein CpaB [Fontimonas sp.]